MPDLEWKASAVADLMAIVDYISDDNPDAALALMDEIQGKVEQHLVGRHAGDHGVDLGRALDLQAVGRIVAEAIDLERGVEVRHDVAEVDGHRGGAP